MSDNPRQHAEDVAAALKRMDDAHQNWEHLASMSAKAWQVYSELRDQWFEAQRRAVLNDGVDDER